MWIPKMKPYTDINKKGNMGYKNADSKANNYNIIIKWIHYSLED